MNSSAKLAIGILAAVALALGIGLTVVLATDSSTSYWSSGNDPYYGMMGAMGHGDWQGMQRYMRQVLGEEGYQRMLEHMTSEGCDWSTGDDDLDRFMHDMSYGMMYRAFNNGATPPAGAGCW